MNHSFCHPTTKPSLNLSSPPSTAAMRRVLLLLKRSAYDLYVKRHQDISITTLHQAEGNLHDRHIIHDAAVRKCKDVLESRHISLKLLFRDELQGPIKDFDLVITIGGDGTLLEASHYLDSSIPVLGVNSDPTQPSEVEEKLEEYDATRSAGYLCAATKDTFEHVLQDIIEGNRKPLPVSRICTSVNGNPLGTYALNDVLLAHPNPAAVTRCSLRICRRFTGETVSPLVHARSSGLRVCTATGSTAAMCSAGGFIMAPSCSDLQYMVREPINPHPSHRPFIHKCIGSDEVLNVKFGSRQGNAYVDGSHLYFGVGFGDVIEFSTEAPELNIFLKDGVSNL